MDARYQAVERESCDLGYRPTFHPADEEDTKKTGIQAEMEYGENGKFITLRGLCLDACRIFKSVVLILLPSPLSKSYGIVPEHSGRLGTTDYLNGIRGTASFVVFTEHFLMKFHPRMFEEYGDKPSFFQLPGVRLLYSGNAMVAIFFVISGFSLSIRPLRAIYDRDWEHLHHILASATLRRAIRLVLPPAVITFVVMVGARFGLYEDHYDGAPDMVLRGPAHCQTFMLQFIDWVEYVLGRLIYPDTWLSPLPNVTMSDYAAPLYTIPQELWSSLILFMVIIGLSKVQPAVRLAAVPFLIILSAWCMRREISCFLAGMIIAELHLRHNNAKVQQSTKMTWKSFGVSCQWSVVFILGIWLASIPHTHGSYGSSSLGYTTIAAVIPWNSNVYNIGAVFMVLAISKLPLLQYIFASSLPQYLGKISFALYLVHWPILAAWGWNFVPVMWKLTGSDTPVRYEFGFGLAVICVTPVVLWAADLCWRLVDINSIRFAKHLETLLVVE